MPKYLTLEVLQKKCMDRRLNAEGNRAHLTERLDRDERQQQESSPANEDDPKCDAILAAEAKIGSDEATKQYAQLEGALQKALDHGQLELEYVMGDTVVGNHRGLDLAAIKHRLAVAEGKIVAQDTKIAAQDTKITSLEAEATQSKDRVARMNERLSTLTLATKEYRHVRARFISTYKRDKLDKATTQDHKIIQEGNPTAHGGDAAVDAMLYDGLGARRDSVIFGKLYGMGPAEVQRLSHEKTLEILSIHAGVIANTTKTGTKEFFDKFEVFIDRFAESDYDVHYLDKGVWTDVTNAYWALLKCKRYEDAVGEQVMGGGD